MTNYEFFRKLNFNDGLSVVKEVFQRFPMQYGSTTGLDGLAQVRPIEFKFEEDGVLYFDTIDIYDSYKEMQKTPYIQVCIGDQESMSYLRIGGKVNFTKEKAVIDKCVENSPVLKSQYGDKKEKIVGYYLTDVWAEFCSFDETIGSYKYNLPNKFD